MRDICISEEPELDLSFVDIVKELTEFWIGRKDLIQRQCVIYQSVVL